MSEKPVTQDTSSVAVPTGYADWLADIKTRVQAARSRAVLAANAELVELYWQIGAEILQRQQFAQWGDKVLDRLARDLREAFPEMKGFSRANLKFMRAFAQAWPEPAIGQQAVSQLPWGHNVMLLTKLKDSAQRLYYAERALAGGWSRSTLEANIRDKLLEAVEFKPEHAGQLNFYLTAVDRQVKSPDDKPTIGLLLCKTRKRTVAEYALSGIDKPIGVAEYRLLRDLPENLAINLPTVAELESELAEEPVVRNLRITACDGVKPKQVRRKKGSEA